MITYDELITRCNEFLFKHMYPGSTLEFRSRQHVDLVRTFFAGVMEGLISVGEAGHRPIVEPIVTQLLDEVGKMAATDWLPDERFWWKPNA